MVFGDYNDRGAVRIWRDDMSHRQIVDAASRLPPGELWTDKRFPADDVRSIYVTGRPASGQPFANGNIRWLRPHEVAGADIGQLALIKDGADAGDVVQGELGDCYLLGAMSSIAAKDLLNPIIATQTDALECIHRGFISFRLYKFGEWQEVSVDTLLPCNERNECIFAHGKDPNELWVPLLEKAYAKLHGCYEALDGGSVTAALVDLTGGVGESIDMTDEDTVYEIADGSFWKRLKRYATKDRKKLQASSKDLLSQIATSGQYLLGAALTQSSIPDNGAHEAMQVTDLGILVNHAYSLIDVAEIGEAHQEKVRLVQLRNPWGLKEWEGPWSDNAREWETAAGRKAKAKLNVTFDGADGTFWMAWEDFQAHFNKIYVCRIFDTVNPLSLRRGEAPPLGTWCRYEIEGAWDDTCSGGCFNFPEWRKNPQFELRTGEMTDAVFLLMQKDPRTEVHAPAQAALGADGLPLKLGGDDGGPQYDKKIGMYVMRGHETYRRKVLFDSDEMEGDEVIDSTPYMAYREVTCNTMDEEDDHPLAPYDRYVLIPTTFEPGKLGPFRIIVLTAKPLETLPELVPKLKQFHLAGAWTETNAGGCRNYYTWRRNEQYSLVLSKPARVSVVLLRHNAEVSDTALHSKKSKAKLASKKKKAKDGTNFLIGFVVARAGPRADRKQLHIVPEEIVDKTQFSPAFEAAAEFYSEEHLDKAPERSYVVVPSTYEPGIEPPNPAKWGDFELLVFTDDERATFGRIEPSTWHFQQLQGEWNLANGSAGGCRNYTSWVRNPLYTLRASRNAVLHCFLRQPTRDDAPDGGLAEYPGIGFYVTTDDGSLSLDDVRCESGFRQQIESHAEFELQSDMPYLLIPMTYRRNVSMSFVVEVYCDQPSCRVEMLPKAIADDRREEVIKHEAARTITRSFLVSRVWGFLRQRPPDREKARQYILKWFRKPVRDNDEGYLDINLALNALESAYIQLTGRADAKGKFFPQMRDRLRQRGHKVADYDVCL